MKRKKYLRVIVPSLLVLCAAAATANVPPPPVNQAIGIADGVFNNMTAAICRSCHQDSGMTPGFLADRHHFLVGTAFRTPSEAIFSTPGGTYECLSCHALVADPVTSATTFTTSKNCLSCHIQKESQATVHHRSLASKARDCQACHIAIDNPNDGHYIPDTPTSPTTPKTGYGSESNGSGGCRYCHSSGIDAASKIQTYSNASTHHSTGIAPPPFVSLQTSGCALCHNTTPQDNIPLIRFCQTCHGIKSLHKIQADSNGDGQIVQGAESPYYGHIGAPADCLGCHGPSIPEGPLPAETIPDAPELHSLSEASFVQGASSIVMVRGSELTSIVENPDGSFAELTAKVALTNRAGEEMLLSPAELSENRLTVTVPSYMPAGSYTTRLVKGRQRSTSKSIAILPNVIVNEVACTQESTTSTVMITGSGFGGHYNGMGLDGSGIGVAMDLVPCMIGSWSDAEISALCGGGCGTEVNVGTLFASTSVPMGSALAVCTTCHGDNSALVDCRNKKWKTHLREGVVDQPVFDLAEKTYLDVPCTPAPTVTKDRIRKPPLISCTDAAQCGANEYCEKVAGLCDSTGTCQPPPTECSGFEDPVCGCDGNTYSNSCLARRQGVNVSKVGECVPPPTSCTTHTQCGTNEYCEKVAGLCDSTGTCQPPPTVCPGFEDPVCGCDGNTYSNSCLASKQGVNIASIGACAPPPTSCTTHTQCGSNEFCAKAAGSCSATGTCQAMPTSCTTLEDPVCGCDGNTYSNSCLASKQGVNVASIGACAPQPASCNDTMQCGTAEYCAKAAGSCNATGTCQPMPTACTTVEAPICGCDGNTYSNSCIARKQGVNIASDGACGTASIYSYYFPSVKDNDALGWMNTLTVQARDFVAMDVTVKVYNMAGSLVGRYIHSSTNPAANEPALAPMKQVVQRPSWIVGSIASPIAVEGSMIIETNRPAIAAIDTVANNYQGFDINEAAKPRSINTFISNNDGPNLHQCYILVQNIYSTPRNITLRLIGKTPTSPGHGATKTITIRAFATLKVRPSEIAGLINFDGTAVVYSDLNIPEDGLGSPIPAAERHEVGYVALAGYESPVARPMLSFPHIRDGKFGGSLDYQSLITVVNPKGNTEANITIVLYSSSGVEQGRLAAVIPPNGREAWRPSSIRGTTTAPLDFEGSIVIATDTPVIGQLKTIYPGFNTYGVEAFNLHESAIPTSSLFFPKVSDNLVADNHLANGYVYIQNPDVGIKTINIEQFKSDGTTNGARTITLGPFATFVHRPYGIVTDGTGTFKGWVKVTEKGGLNITGVARYDIHNTNLATSKVDCTAIYRSMGQ